MGLTTLLVLLAWMPAAALSEEVTVALAGDLLLVETPPPECRSQVDAVVRMLSRADLAVANLETSLVGDDPVPAATSGGLWLRAGPGAGEWLRRSGLDVVSQANNHAGDWGPEGASETRSRLRESGVETAGFGDGEAGAWGPVSTEAHGATVAVLAAASLPHRDPLRAKDPEPGFAARPGIAAIDTRTILEMSPGRYATLTSLLREAGLSAPVSIDSIHLGDLVVRQGRLPSVVVELDSADRDRLRRAVASAAVEAEIVLVSLHCAEGEALGWDPPRELRSLAEELAEAGADAVFVHGPHHLRGAEWAGPDTVAFYGLGSLVLQHHRVTGQPREAYRHWGVDPDRGIGALLERVERAMGPPAELWDGLLATLVFNGGRLDRVELTALDLAGNGSGDPCRGLPAPAVGTRREEILGRVAGRSRNLRGDVVFSGHGALLIRTEDGGTVAH